MPYLNIAIPAAGATGTNELVAAVPGKRIRVTSCLLVGAASVEAYFASDTTAIYGGDVDAPFPLGDKNFVLDHGPGWFQTAPGEPLNLVLDADVSVVGGLTYAVGP